MPSFHIANHPCLKAFDVGPRDLGVSEKKVSPHEYGMASATGVQYHYRVMLEEEEDVLISAPASAFQSLLSEEQDHTTRSLLAQSQSKKKRKRK